MARVVLAALLCACAPRRSAPAAAGAAPPAPCAAAPRCLCADDRFACDAVPFHRFPATEAGVRHVSVWGARLGALEEAALDARALHTLVLVACRLGALHPAALASMRSTLASLDLGHNEFTEIPLEGLRGLQVLNWLNLQNNYISELNGDAEWGGLAASLTSLSLSNNRLVVMRAGALRALRGLASLELDGNRLRALDAGALPRALVSLRLSDNVLRALPCVALAALPRLRHLALRDNLLRLPAQPTCLITPGAPAHAHLYTLDLAQNALDDDFRPNLGFRMQLGRLILDLNNLTRLPPWVAEGGRLEKLSVSHNRLQTLPEATLSALAGELRQLELDYNELEVLPAALRVLTRLRRLSVAQNRLRAVPALPPTLSSLSLAGNAIDDFPEGLHALEPGTLAHLDLSYNLIGLVAADAFGAWASALDTLSLRGNRLVLLAPGAFPALPLRELALGFNELLVLEDEALAPLRALAVLELSGVPGGGGLPRAPPGLAWLALDDSDLRRVDAADLLAQPHLEHLNLDFNKIVEFPSGTACANASMRLKELRLAYNYISSIDGEFLSLLSDLQSVDLSYNRMPNVSAGTFVNLSSLVFVGLAGNAIERLSAGAFCALPRLQSLELQYNRLTRLAIASLQDVAAEEGNLSVNVSHNQISILESGGTAPISVLDLSYNVLESVSGAFLEGAATHLQHLLLAHNRLTALESLGALPRLVVLSLRDNALTTLRRRALAAAPALEELDVARNRLEALQPDQFQALRHLRVLGLAGNRLRAVPPDALEGTLLDALDLRDNKLEAAPAAAVARVGFTLRRLELGGNPLGRLDAAVLAGAGFLRELGLASVGLRVLPDAAMAGLGRLRRLDLSHNALVANHRELLHSVPKLWRLALAGTRLNAFPTLPLPRLRELDLSANAIAACREEDVRSLPELRALNLSHNRLTVLQQPAWAALPRLAVLDVAHNPVARAVSELEGLARLVRLRVHGLRAAEPPRLGALSALRELEIDVGRGAVGAALAAVPQLQALRLHVRAPVLDAQLAGLTVDKLRAVEVRGTALRVLSARGLAPLVGVPGRALALRVRGTRLGALPAGLAGLAARAPSLSLELVDNALTSLAPQAFYPNLTGWSRSTIRLFSGGLVVQEAGLRCGCASAWLGAWLRRWAREAGGGARAALAAARRSWCAAPAPAPAARPALLALRLDAAACRARALSARASPPLAGAAPALALGALALLLPRS